MKRSMTKLIPLALIIGIFLVIVAPCAFAQSRTDSITQLNPHGNCFVHIEVHGWDDTLQDLPVKNTDILSINVGAPEVCDIWLQKLAIGIDATDESVGDIVKNITLYQGNNAVSKTVAMPREINAITLQKPIFIKAGTSTKFIVRADIMKGQGEVRFGSSYAEGLVAATLAPVWNASPQWAKVISLNQKGTCSAMYMLGGADYNHPQVAVNFGLNDVWKFNGAGWVHVDNDLVAAGIQEAPWIGRSYPGTMIFNNKLWIMGGLNTTTPFVFKNDVWSMDNAGNWTQATAAAAWNARYNFGAVNFGKMFIFGGLSSANPFVLNNDVWASADGITWSKIDANPVVAGVQNAPWTARYNFGSAVFNGKIFLMGGQDANGMKNDIWTTVDGVTWKQTDTNPMQAGIQNAPWSPRMDFTTLVYNNRLWIMGGMQTSVPSGMLNEVWSTADGITWTKFDNNTTTGGIQNAPWSPRTALFATVYQGKVWMSGGNLQASDGFGGYLIDNNANDLWSFDGVAWTRFDHDPLMTAGIQDAPWLKRSGAAFMPFGECR